MDLPDWADAMPSPLAVPLSAIGIYLVVLLLVRLNGLRSFSTMSAFDFAITVATGTLIASTLLNDRPSLLEGAVGVLALFVLQRIVSSLRRIRPLRRLIDNAPLLLVRDGVIQEENLKRARVTHADLYAHLRQQGVVRLEDVRLVVFETTGQMSVVHMDRGTPDDAMLREVRR